MSDEQPSTTSPSPEAESDFSGQDSGIRDVYDTIDAEEGAASLELRVADLQQDIERGLNRVREYETSRRGEVELMRARVDEAVELLREATEEQRGAWDRFERQVTDLIANSEAAAREQVADVREDLRPRVEHTSQRIEDVAAQFKGELQSLTNHIDAKVTGRLEELAEQLSSAVAELRNATTAEQQDRAAAVEAVRAEVVSRLQSTTSQIGEKADATAAQLEALRRELDGTAGELRAAINLKAAELREQQEASSQELTGVMRSLESVTNALTAAASERDEEVAARLTGIEAGLRSAIRSEHTRWAETADELTAKIGDVTVVIEDVQGRLAGDAARQVSELEGVRGDVSSVGTRLDVLERTVAQAVREVASELSNRVTGVAGQVDALRSSVTSHAERLGSVDGMEARIRDVENRAVSAAHSGDGRIDKLEERLQALEGRLERSLAEAVVAAGEASVDNDAREGLDALQGELRRLDNLRPEVRELATKVSEVAVKVDETDRVARQAATLLQQIVQRARQAEAPMPEPAPDRHSDRQGERQGD